MDFQDYLTLDDLSEQSKKTYMYGYNKLTSLLNKRVEISNDKTIISAITSLSIPLNSKKVMLISAIKAFNYDEKSTTRLSKYLEKLNNEIAVYTESTLKNLILPSLKELQHHNKQQFKNEDWTGFIITYLLLHFNFRNKDINLIITKNKSDVLDKTKNWIFIRATYIMIYINDYKTASAYGEKTFKLKSLKILHALNEYLDNSSSKPLIPNVGSNLGNFIMRHTYKNVGEAIYYKVIVSELASRGKMKELQKTGLSRGTNMETIVSSYLS